MKKRRFFPFIKQAGMMECGTTCLAMIFKYYGYYDIKSFLAGKAEVSAQGIDLFTLSELAEGFGFETDGYELEYKYLQEIHLPCIAHYEGNHFVVVYRSSDKYVWISDPAIGKYKLTKSEFNAKWNGVVLVLNPTDNIFKYNELTELVEAERIKQKSIVREVYLPSLLSSKKLIIQILLGTFILQFLGLVLPFFTQAIIDHVLVNKNVKLLYAILVGLVLVFFAQIFTTYGRNMLLVQLKATFERKFFSKFFDHLIKLNQIYFDNHKKEDFINRFQENLKIRKALNPSVLEGLLDLVFIFFYLIILVSYHWLLGLIASIFILLYVLYAVFFFPKLKNLENKVFAENVKTIGQVMDTLLGIQTVRLLGIEKLKFWKWKNQYTKALNKVLETERQYITLNTILNAIFFTSRTSIYWLGAYFAFMNEISIGQYIAFITIYTMVMNSLSRITQISFLFTELTVTFDKLNDVFIQEVADYSLENKKGLKSADLLSVKNVYFKYRSNQENYILKGVNVDIEHGEFVGIVGRNGSGKSTLIKLISRLYDHYTGEITINGQNIKNIARNELVRKMGVIPQEVFLFDGTIKDNIKYGNFEATDQQVIEAAKKADLHDFVKQQYLGYNLKVGENGTGLSGGQKLKVAFARLFVANPDIIILDEASSALDVETEMKIMSNIKTYFKGKTIISIAHRLNTLRGADRIIVLDHGVVVENGSHEELLENEGVYKKFIDTYINY
ncbi:peptidase domain-containing ABC transporter [Fulvivirga sediminis]|uniref:Peptidase domain-containing ABC transporter n=1 Tax=Fulvivirga sediminis TaxID=2803949 RepID=A0A937K0Z7_9BACT|nr:peptidase domain-containing ABC transporter [Fulvivirga sediminis]MBL3658104.1 peptidase domain-containing ABC transporter [Fulvivirga sediminis]